MNSLLPSQQSKPVIKKTQFIWIVTAILFIAGLGIFFTNSIVETIDTQKRSIPKKTSRTAIKKSTKEWKDAVKKIKESKGKGNNSTVKNKEAAKELILEGRPDLKEYPTYSKEQYKAGYEYHPAEPDVGNDLPHIKWKDWSNGKSDGSEGHIFFEKE